MLSLGFTTDTSVLTTHTVTHYYILCSFYNHIIFGNFSKPAKAITFCFVLSIANKFMHFLAYCQSHSSKFSCIVGYFFFFGNLLTRSYCLCSWCLRPMFFQFHETKNNTEKLLSVEHFAVEKVLHTKLKFSLMIRVVESSIKCRNN